MGILTKVSAGNVLYAVLTESEVETTVVRSITVCRIVVGAVVTVLSVVVSRSWVETCVEISVVGTSTVVGSLVVVVCVRVYVTVYVEVEAASVVVL